MESVKKDNQSKMVLAVILIAVGIIWFISMINIRFHLEEVFWPFFRLFGHIGKIIFSWPMILIMVGLVLVAGQRSGGWILVIAGGIFLLPRIVGIPHFPVSVIFPLILILAGGALIMKRI